MVKNSARPACQLAHLPFTVAPLVQGADPTRRADPLTREVDGAVVVGINLVNHILKLRLGGVLAKGSHDGTQLLGSDLTYYDTGLA